jgi:hypothetical protein
MSGSELVAGNPYLNLFSIPTDVLQYHIFPHLPTCSLLAIKFVCKMGRNIVQRGDRGQDLNLLSLVEAKAPLKFFSWFESQLLYRWEQVSDGIIFRSLAQAAKGWQRFTIS